MTVCVATICDGASLLGASDRMLTAGDVEFEPPMMKIRQLTSSIAIMSAGDASFQAEIATDLNAWINTRLEEQPSAWIPIADAANAYARCHGEAKRRRVERAFLVPLGLTSDTFVSRQQEMAPELVRELTREILNYALPGVATIMAGVDGLGPHLYTIDNGFLMCNDTIGFCAIGAGANHANSTLMSARYTPATPLAESLMLTFIAKKRAEVAPGVGAQTDMFTLGPAPGTLTSIRDSIVADLGKMSQNWIARERKAFDAAIRKARDYVKRIAEDTVEKPQASAESAAPGEPPADAPVV